MAEIRGFSQLRTLRSSTLFIDDRARERDALAAFGLETHCPIGLAGADRALTRDLAQIAFPNSIADANDHGILEAYAEGVGLVRMIRKGIARHSHLFRCYRCIGWNAPRARLRHSHSNGPNRNRASQGCDQSSISAQISATTG